MTKLRTCLRWAVAAATLAVLLLLGWQCIDIYRVGNSPANLDAAGVHLTPVYTAQNVGERLTALALPLGLYGVLLLAGILAHAGHAPEASPAGLTPENRLRLMKKRHAQLPAAALREEKLRREMLVVLGAGLAVCAVMCLAYLLDGDHFVSWDLETVMGDMMGHIAPWVLLGIALAFAGAIARDRSLLRECDILRGQKAEATAPRQEKHALPINWLRGILCAAALLFILLGVMNGGWYDVLVKAINICTECIGLG